MWLFIARLRFFKIRFLCFIKASKVIILKNIKVEDITGNIAANIMLYKFISFVFNINALDWDLQYKIKK